MLRMSEEVAADAFEAYRDGDLLRCIHMLVDYADRGVRNERTAYIFTLAIDAELARFRGDVSVPDEDAPFCAHCRSPSTYVRVSDGDVGCNDCSGIMPHDEVDG
jgi:hypothetical protein